MTKAANDDGGHEPVMLQEVIELLQLRPGDEAIDCTFGGGGYTRALLKAVAPDGRVLAIDRDPEAVARGRSLSWPPDEPARLNLVHANFTQIRQVANEAGFRSVRGIAADLGLSSRQLEASNRGFSFLLDGPLDMRFDSTSQSGTAADLIARLSVDELERLLRLYGEEPAARRIAEAIVRRRRQRAITTTAELVDCITQAVPRRGRLHPATRTFQALRIMVNDELRSLEDALPAMLETAAVGGRIAIVSFHSLEDRIVKRFFRQCAARGAAKIIARKAQLPSPDEIKQNPRSRSAKLRVLERI